MKIINKTALVALMALAAATPAGAQSRHISLDEAVSMSLQNSKQLRISGAKITEADANLRQAKDGRLPNVTVSGTYLRLANPDIDLKIKTGSGSGNPDAKSTPDVNQAAYGIANASYPLFAGFRIQSGIESAKYLAQAARLDADNDRQGVIINAIGAYANLYKATEAVRLVKQNLSQSQQRVKDFSSLEQNGLMARNDLLKAQLQQSNVELSLLDAENNLRITNINMNLMLGLPESTELSVDSAFSYAADDRSMEDWEGLAIQSRKDAAALVLRAKSAEQGIRNAKSEAYPTIALTGGYIGAYVPNVITIKDAINAGIGVQYNLGSLWKNNTQLTQARARLLEVQSNQSLLEDNIRVQVTQAYQNFLLSKKKIYVYEKAVEQAQENYRIVNNKYGNSLATATEVLDADVASLQAQLNYALSKADAAVAYQRLLQATGTIAAGNATR